MGNNNTIEKLMQYYNDNPDAFADDIESLDVKNECLGDDRCYPMDILDGFFYGKSPSEMIEMVCSGGDADEGGPFKPCRKYFCFNGLGGIISTDDRDYRYCFLDDEYVKAIIDNASTLDLSEGAQAIINGQDND